MDFVRRWVMHVLLLAASGSIAWADPPAGTKGGSIARPLWYCFQWTRPDVRKRGGNCFSDKAAADKLRAWDVENNPPALKITPIYTMKAAYVVTTTRVSGGRSGPPYCSMRMDAYPKREQVDALFKANEATAHQMSDDGGFWMNTSLKWVYSLPIETGIDYRCPAN